jgi:hypothetical protein
LTAAQLEAVVLSVDDIGALMGATDVEVSEGSFFLGLATDEAGGFPAGVEVEAREYWSLDLAETEAAGRGGRTIGVGPVDYVSVILLSAAEDSDAESMFDRVTSAEPAYTRWVPITVRGATVAEQAVGIPYEGEPDDEPVFESVLARTDTLVVGVIVSGGDIDALAAAATSLTELIFERAREVAGGDAVDAEGGDGTGDALADAFAEQLIGHGDLTPLDEARVECFASRAIANVDDDRLGELGFTIDNISELWVPNSIPLWTQVGWTDTEIDLLVGSLEECVGGDPESVKAVLVGPVARYQPDFADCYAAEVSAAGGDDFYLDAFRIRFLQPGDEPDDAFTEVSNAAAVACQPDQPSYAEPAGEGD